MSATRRDRRVLSNRSASVTKSRRRSKRAYALEMLENRTLLTYTFTYDPVTHVASAVGDASSDSLVISPIGGLLEHSVNGGAFDSDWTGFTVPAANTETVDITLSSGDGSTLQLGGDSGANSGGAASLLNAAFDTIIPANTTDTLTVDDSAGTTLANPYAIDTGAAFTITGPGINYFEPSGFFGGGITLDGSAVDGNVYNVLSTLTGGFEPVNVVTGAGVGSTVNVGDASQTVGLIGSTLAIFGADASSATTINVNDGSDTTNATATLDDASGNPSAPFEVTGLSPEPIEYGAGVTALNVTGGTSGGSTGVTYDINNTQAGTSTSIIGGVNQNFYNLAASTGVLDNLLGPVATDGAGAGDQVVVDDSNNGADDNYAINDTTVTSTGLFGGLTYGGLGAGGLLHVLTSQGSNVIDVNNTADGIDTTVDTEAGTDTVNVNGTGTGATLAINTGNSTTDPATVNVLSNNEPVNISSFASFPTVTTVNIGSTGGPGSMANIQGAISVANPPSLTSLNFHDENDTTGQVWTLDNDDNGNTGSVALTGSATTTYVPSDLSDMTVNAGSGGNLFFVNNTSGMFPTTLNTGTGDDVVSVFASGDNTLNIQGQDGTDLVTLGGNTAAPLGMQGLVGTINVDNSLGSTDLVLDDSQDTDSQTALLFNDGANGQVTGLSPATINYTNSGTDSLTVMGGSGGNTFTVDGTLVNPTESPTITDLFTGDGDDTTFVESTNAGSQLNIHGQSGQDSVTIGFFGSLADILGPVNVDNDFGFTDLTVDASQDLVSHDFTLSNPSTTVTLTGLAPADITYTYLDLSSLTINTSAFGSQVMNIDMSGGNPIPYVNTPGLTWNAGADATSGLGSHVLNIFGELPSGPFASETHNAEDPAVGGAPHFGSIFFDDGQGAFNSLTNLAYTGLQPITDTTPAINYTLNDFGSPDQSFGATTGPVVGGFQTIEFASTPTPPVPTNWETTDVANKNSVTFNTPAIIPGFPGAGVIGTVNIPVPSDGLISLTFNTPTGGDNNVSFVNTPPGVITSLNGGADEDVTNVTGLGVADGTVLFLNGGASTNTLNYDAGGEIPIITPGLLPGEILISIPGAGTGDAINYQNINITNLGPLVITPGPAVTINTVEGFQNVDSIVGTFTAPNPVSPASPGGFPASAFTASIDWGDPSPDADAGTIIQDASNPSIYYIKGTHTFLENGTYTVDSTINFAGGSFTIPVNGVPITISFGPSGPVAGTPATANVTQGPLAVSAFPIVGTEGVAVGAGPIATFIDAGGADPIGNYSATVDIFDAMGTLVSSFPAASITQNGNASQFTVNAPSFTLPEEGTYQVVVSVTDSGGTTPITVSATSHAVVADAPLTAGATVLQSLNTGVPSATPYTVGSFTDGNLNAPVTDFTGTIDWGDGSPNSVASFTSTAPGAFDVTGNHIYAKPGVYTVTTNIIDEGGATTTLIASFTVTDLPVTGATKNFTAVEDQNTGPFILATFEDPNTLATVADVNATLAVGGWGDGTPTVAGVGLTVVQVGVDPANGEPIFDVIGSHTYAEERPPGPIYTLSVIITTRGGVSTTLTSPPGGGVTVLDAQLTSSNGTTITGIEGVAPSGTVLLGTFTDFNQHATVADFTAGAGSVVVDWGDGSAAETLTAANLTIVGSPDGVIFTVKAAHTYAEEGTYAYNVTVTDTGGAVTIFSGAAVIADAALSPSATQPTISTTEASIFTVPVFAPPVFKGAVASFSDGNTLATTADFFATIDWGDGTPMTAGKVSQPGGAGTAFIVSGSHTYADSGVTTGTGTSGTFDIQVFITDDGGSRLIVANTATVADNSIPVSGQLNPSSDTGLSTGTPNVTSEKLPDFFGKSEPLSTVTLSAALLPSGTPFIIGQVAAGSDGSWNIRSNIPLADGHYAITATAIDQFGMTTVTTPTSPVVINSNLLVDTTGPVIAGMFFNRLNGQVDFTIQDPVNPDGSAPSGVWVNSLLDSSNYELTKVHPEKNFPGRYYVSNVTVTADPSIPFAYDVAVTFNGGRSIRGGFYLMRIRDSSNGDSSVQDLAENHLDGNFYGSFPSGNGINGSDFVAELQAYHSKVFAPQTIIGTANAGNGGVGGKRANAVHSGVFVPVIPRGGAPIFSTPNGAVAGLKTKAKKGKGQIVVKAKHGAPLVKHHATQVAKHAKVVHSSNHPRGPKN